MPVLSIRIVDVRRDDVALADVKRVFLGPWNVGVCKVGPASEFHLAVTSEACDAVVVDVHQQVLALILPAVGVAPVPLAEDRFPSGDSRDHAAFTASIVTACVDQRYVAGLIGRRGIGPRASV